MRSSLSNLETLCFCLGWQGGTVHQVAHELGVSTSVILEANADKMHELCRKAQRVHWNKTDQVFIHFGLCLDVLLLDYAGHDTPIWLKRAVDYYNNHAGAPRKIISSEPVSA